MAATTANIAWPIQANSPSIPSFRKSLVPKNDFNVYKSLITQDKGSYINRMAPARSFYTPLCRSVGLYVCMSVCLQRKI